MRILVCLGCRCELEQVAVAKGRALVLCVTCESICSSDEFVHRRRLSPAGHLMGLRVSAAGSSKTR